MYSTYYTHSHMYVYTVLLPSIINTKKVNIHYEKLHLYN